MVYYLMCFMKRKMSYYKGGNMLYDVDINGIPKLFVCCMIFFV